jgi:hypothetical protein
VPVIVHLGTLACAGQGRRLEAVVSARLTHTDRLSV